MGDGKLRDRIAAAIREAANVLTPFDADPYTEMADAVIKELGLRPEWGTTWGGEAEPFWLSEVREDLTDGMRDDERLMCRYITAWQ